MCFKIKALFLAIWVALGARKGLPHTKSFTRKADKLASRRGGLVREVELSKHSGQGWHQPWHGAGLREEVGKEGRKGKEKTRVVQNMFSSHSPWVPWPPSSNGTSVP